MGISGCKKEPPKPPPVAEVVAVAVQPKTVPVTTSFVAQAESSHQVEVVARVNGFLEKITYKEGDLVKPGQTLFVMDKKPFIAQVNAAKGEVENRQAQLWTAKANFDRIQPLAAKNAASKSDLDNATGSLKAAEAMLFEAKARLEKAELDLSYTTIAAPVAGVTGQALLREGAFLTAAGQAAKLTYVAKIDPIWINFSVSQNQLATNRQEIASGRLSVPANLNYDVEVELSDGSKYPYTGKISFADPSFNQQTGTFLVRAELPNPKGVLRPGMFVKATLRGAVRPNALTVPQKAVQETSNGHVVYLVNDKGQAEVRPVVVGDWSGNDWIINQGLQAGEKVIVEGFQRLAPGAPVKIITAEEAAAKAAAAAKPAEGAKPTEGTKAEAAGKTEQASKPAAPAAK